MTRDEAEQFRARWKVVNDFIAEEARSASPALKLRQLALMYEAGQVFGWSDEREEDVAKVRERWRRLREIYCTASTSRPN